MRLPLATFTVSFLALSGALAHEWKPQLVARDESADRNIPNFRFDSRHTASGHFQITDSNWRHYAPLLGIDLGVWPNAMSAPEQLQGQVAGRMWAENGYMPWVPYNARLRRDLGTPRADHTRRPAFDAGEDRRAAHPGLIRTPEVTHPNPFARPVRTPRELAFTGG